MDFLQNLQNMLGQGLSSLGNANDDSRSAPGRSNASATSDSSSSGGLGALSDLFSPAALGGLAGALFSGRGSRGGASSGGLDIGGMIKGALVAGGGAYLWNKYKDRIMQANADKPNYGQAAPADAKAERMVRALVYAAKSDGHIDEKEQAAIEAQLKKMNLGSGGDALLRSVMNEPLDPERIAASVRDPEEALQLFTVSCAVLDIDQYMEKNYLDALAAALKIPADVRDEIENKLKSGVA